MKNVLKSSLFALSGLVLGVSGFYFYAKAQDDSILATLVIPATLNISDDGVNFSIANLIPQVVDTSQTNTLTVSGNDPDGFRVDVELEDLDETLGQLCDDAGGGVCGTKIFDGDGTSTYVSFTSNTGSGDLDGLTGATFTGSETKLGAAGSYQAFTASEATNPEPLEIDYDAFTDFTGEPGTYNGTMRFTIVAN